MVWHDRPGEEAVTLAIEDEKSFLDETRNFGPPQPAGAQAAIEHFFGRRLRLVPNAKLCRDLRRQAVSETERHKLDSVLRVEVGQVAPRMPAFGFHDLTLSSEFRNCETLFTHHLCWDRATSWRSSS